MPEGIGYDTQALGEYLAKIRGGNTGSITDQVPSFTNLSGPADAGAFDVRSPQQRLADDVAQEQEILNLSIENEKIAKEKDDIRSGPINEIMSTATLRSLRSKEEHDLRVKIRSDHKAIDDAEGIPMHDKILETFMNSGGDFATNPSYIDAYAQRDVAIGRATRKKKELEANYEDSFYRLDQIDNRITTVTPFEEDRRRENALTAASRIDAEGKLGITRIERELTATSYGIPVADVTAAHYKDMGEDRINFQTAYASGRVFTGAEVATYHPESVPDFLAWEANRNSIETTEKQSVITEWDAKAQENMKKVRFTKEERKTALDSGMTAEEQQTQLETKRIQERVRTIEAEKKKYKSSNVKVDDLSLEGDPTANEVDKRTANFLIANMKKTLAGRNIYDVGYWDVVMFTQTVKLEAGYMDNIHHGDKLNETARKMWKGMIANFNAEHGTAPGVLITSDEFAMWGVQP